MAARRNLLLGLIGTGIGPSLSPPLHEHEARALGMRCSYRLLDLDDLGRDVDATIDLITAAAAVGFDGVNLTHPCKRIVVGQLDALSPDAAAIGAVNTVVFRDGRSVGYNTDGTGFAQAFRQGLPGVQLDHVVLLGAGGAGAALARALLSMGVRTLSIADADVDRAAQVAASVTEAFAHSTVEPVGVAALADLLSHADGIVHATPSGMAAHPGLPFPADLLRSSLWVVDIVYRPLETPLLRVARELGCQVLDGGGMVVFQAAEAFRLFTGREPDTDRMLDDFHRLVRAEALADARST